LDYFELQAMMEHLKLHQMQVFVQLVVLYFQSFEKLQNLNFFFQILPMTFKIHGWKMLLSDQ